MAFAWLVARAQWRTVRVRYKERGICLERGQLAISVREFAYAMDRDKAWIERLFKRLKNEGMVQTVVETGVTVVTICNYNQYQADCDAVETVDETRGETQARQAQDTEQGREKGKKESKRAAPVPVPDWMPKDEWAAFRKFRKAMKVPFTDDAERGIIADLDTLRGGGHCPKLVLMKAVKRGWRGVFGDEDTKAKAVPVQRDAAWHEGQARFFEKIGKPDDAAEHRRKAMSIGQLAAEQISRAA